MNIKENREITLIEASRLLRRNREYSFNFKSSKKSEEEFETLILSNLDEILELLKLPPAVNVKRQFNILPTKGLLCKVILDILVIHNDYTVSVFEVKCFKKERGATDQLKSIGQSLFYHIAIEERFGVDPRVFVIDWKITHELFQACLYHKLPITLLELNGDRLLVPYSRYTYGKKSII